MPTNEEFLAEAPTGSVTPELVPDDLRTGPWRAYPKYEEHHFKRGERGDPDAYVVAAQTNLVTCEHPAPRMRAYRPLVDEPGLFLRFARLWDNGVTRGAWKDWIGVYGALGLHNGNVRGGERETYSAFADEARQAHEIQRLYEAAANPDKVDKIYIQKYFYPMEPDGPLQHEALWVVGARVQKKLSEECFPQLYFNADGTSVLSYGFRSLLGAMYLQMAGMLAAGTTAVRWCKAPDCFRIINLERRKDAEFCSGKACEMRWRRANGKA